LAVRDPLPESRGLAFFPSSFPATAPRYSSANGRPGENNTSASQRLPRFLPPLRSLHLSVVEPVVRMEPFPALYFVRCICSITPLCTPQLPMRIVTCLVRPEPSRRVLLYLQPMHIAGALPRPVCVFLFLQSNTFRLRPILTCRSVVPFPKRHRASFISVHPTY